MLLAGCNLVFPIEAGTPGDGAPGDDDAPRRDGAPRLDAAACDGPDEDLDGIPDACDNCPQLPNLDQDNRDGDDLGDACDRLGAGTECIALFDGFGDDQRATFDLTNAVGDWTILNGQLVQNDAGELGAFAQSVASYGVDHVELAFHYTAPTTDAIPAEVGVWLGAKLPDDGIRADLAPQGDVAAVRTVTRITGVDTVVSAEKLGLGLAAGKLGDLGVDRFSGSLEARGTISDGGNNTSDATTAGTVLVPDPGRIALHTNALVVAFDWVLVVGVSPSGPCPPRAP